MANRWMGRDGARLVAAGRVLMGVGALARPRMLPSVLGVDSGTAERMSWLTRMFGAREIALGAGVLLSRSPEARREWVLGGVLSDAADALALAAAVRRGVVRGALGAGGVALAAGATGTGVMAWLDSGTDSS